MKACIFFITMIQFASMSIAENRAPSRLLDGIIKHFEDTYYSQGVQPGWTGVVSIYSGVLSFPDCRQEMLEYVKGKVLKDADVWPEIIPLYLQIGGDPELVVGLLPALKNPQAEALAKVYLMIQKVPSGKLPESSKNTSTCLKATLRHENGDFVVSIANIDQKYSVLFAHGTHANLSIWRTDGIDLPVYRTPRRGPLNQKSLIVLNPGDKYEFRICGNLTDNVIPAIDCYIDKGTWYAPSSLMQMPGFWALDGTVVASDYDCDPIQLEVQYVYNPSVELQRISPLILEQYQSNSTFNMLLLPEDVGVVTSDPIPIKRSVTRSKKGSALRLWNIPWKRELTRDEFTGEWTKKERKKGSSRQGKPGVPGL